MQRYRLNLVTAPVIEPVTVTEAKLFMLVSSSDDDTLITNLIIAARTNAEAFTKRAFITQTWKMLMDNYPQQKGEPWWHGVKQLPISVITGKTFIDIPLAPLQSVTHFKTYDDADSATTFSASNYYVSEYSGDFAPAGKITLRSGQTFPGFGRNADGIEIQFVAGYGTTATSVPYQIKQAILQEVSYMYENRGACATGGMCCNTAQKLLQPFRLERL